MWDTLGSNPFYTPGYTYFWYFTLVIVFATNSFAIPQQTRYKTICNHKGEDKNKIFVYSFICCFFIFIFAIRISKEIAQYRFQ